MAKKTVADVAKAKAEKQKKMVIGLSVFLVLALAYGVHTMMSLNGSGSAASKPQVSTTAAGSTGTPAATPAATPSALPAAPTLSAADPTTATTSSSSSSLIDAVKPPAESGQLQSFSLFASKDPFNSGGPGSSSGKSSSSSGSSKGSGSSAPPKPPAAPPAPPTAPPSSAVIAINGVSESVQGGAGFPAANPMFDLLSLTASSAKVSVIGGSYASGSAALTLKVGTPVTLVNTADGTRYTLELMPQGTVPSSTGAPASGGATTAPTATTPSATP
jgi:hypothetical protein